MPNCKFQIKFQSLVSSASQQKDYCNVFVQHLDSVASPDSLRNNQLVSICIQLLLDQWTDHLQVKWELGQAAEVPPVQGGGGSHVSSFAFSCFE